jgi:glutathione peroxidase-family protein
VFLVGRDGRIRAKFEGAVSERELEAAVRRFLT